MIYPAQGNAAKEPSGHPGPGAGNPKHLGTLHLSTNQPIARFKVIEQSDNSDLILNLDRLVLKTLPRPWARAMGEGMHCLTLQRPKA